NQGYFSDLKNIGNFTHIHFVRKEELLNLYRSSDIFIMPSITETFGLVYAEAMTQGLPLIYSANQGFDKQFEEGKVGYRVEPKDVDEIANRIHAILKRYNEISLNCYHCSDKFDWDIIAEKYLKMYENL